MAPFEHLLIDLKFAEKQSLLILLHKDGTINRAGDDSGRLSTTFYIGITDTADMLAELAGMVTAEFEDALNKVFDLPEKKGVVCSLEIVLSDGKETKGIKFLYGSDSMGPPSAVKDFVTRAIILTDPWFLQQQKAATPIKKWWQFWK